VGVNPLRGLVMGAPAFRSGSAGMLPRAGRPAIKCWTDPASDATGLACDAVSSRVQDLAARG